MASMVVMLGGCSLKQSAQQNDTDVSESIPLTNTTNSAKNQTEIFINKWLKSEQGLIITYIKESKQEDTDLVAGRDALSESLGLSMVYAINKNDERLFAENEEILTDFFIEKDGFVYWKLTESGEKEVTTNALVDDARIANALISASKLWEDDSYAHVAEVMTEYMFKNNVNQGSLVDYYDRKNKLASTDITLSYIDPEALENVAGDVTRNKQIVENTINILQNAPLKNGFYPKSYEVDKKAYHYDSQVNIVDQAIIAYHQAKAGESSDAFLEFIRQEMDNNGYINGMYDLNTKRPVVNYESPAVYSFLIMYLLEIDELSLANQIYQQMILLRDEDSSSPYYGGYSVTNGDTHVFDNILPLIAEQLLHEQ